jgi:ABC-type phosphate transport system ATPase subunit
MSAACHFSIESGRTDGIFTSPREQLTEDYVTGRLG